VADPHSFTAAFPGLAKHPQIFCDLFLRPLPFDSSGMFKYQAVSSGPVLTLSKPGMFFLLLSYSKQLPVFFINQKTEIHRSYFLF
jgi:hypothetical protein